MRKIFFSNLLFIFIATGLYAQIEATTSDGKKVTLNQDGTWQYNENKVTTESTIPEDCSNFIFTQTDKMTGSSSIAAKEILMVSDDGGKTGLRIYVL